MRAPLIPALIGLGFAGGLLVGAVVTAGGAPHGAAPAAIDLPQVPSERPAGARYPAEVLRVIDGDTFEARVRVWPGLEVVTKVRLRDIDAPELSAHCAAEQEKAAAARTALAILLAEGEVAVGTVSPDKYGGRVLASAATRATPDVSTALLAMGHARAYAGKRRQGWCG